MLKKTDLLNTNINTPFLLEDIYPLEWHMTRNEKYCLISLLENIKPEVTIEIGTNKGGSLQVLSRYSDKTYSIDIDSKVKTELSEKFDNVEFLTGDSKLVIPSLLEKEDIKSNLEFVLIDGDHSYDGVKSDINCFLEFVPQKPLYIIFHDSFNPECRKGIKAADYKNCEYVHYIEYDFVSGVFNPNNLYREMWGGLALVIMLPHKRNGNLVISESQKEQFSLTYLHSIHLFKDKIKHFKSINKLFKKK